MALYYPAIFEVADTAAAKAIILTPETGTDTDTRWALETPYVLELIAGATPVRADSIVLDYGCGIGRVAKALIESTGCFVIGVDISASMRRLAVDYAGSDRFMAVSPEQFDSLAGAGLRVHVALAVWVLQHCFAPADDIDRIRRGLGAEGRVFVLNMPVRAVPALLDTPVDGNSFAWMPDGHDIPQALRAAFRVEQEGIPDTSRVPNMADAGAFWMSLRGQD